MLLERLLSRIVTEGRLEVILPDNKRLGFGPGNTPHVVVRLKDWATVRRLGLRPDLELGEAWMDQRLKLEQGSLRELLTIACGALRELEQTGWHRLQRRLLRPFRYLAQFNPLYRARRNVAHHYDLSGELFDLFLDSDRQYSCAYFETGAESLEEAQAKKKRHLAAKLCLAPDQRVLDIGSGWGGMGLSLARYAPVDVTGVTLSTEQLEVATRRAAQAGLDDRVRFRLQDYREETGPYDRIISVGMFEHVGVTHYRPFFGHLRRLLKPDGVAVLHAIGRMSPPARTNPWIARYIFPGGYCPALSEVLRAVEKAQLWVTDVEILRLHYAHTLRAWHERFLANRDRIRELYDERFCRMWEYYLLASEAAFLHLDHMVFQIQLARDRHAVPLTRNYIQQNEAHLAALDGEQRTGLQEVRRTG
ncbi:cyclopropane-fatty-acyl-phospholipid synthase [Alkalispirillum mobile]|uniref:Cyclopropane-fatty-acyl-phospholipid synthase n=1 Tax=Alkalispirillum mobile TaxID=85925 RepID=A0A498CDQ9_9GAMM|nr:cyclopropane-fatty-acyl-phospholipid synthase family protein [Alkalispirillum mobile]RLK51440.1 cyclopropane-fatty-acyl-phospholipid synthase [Alkalispirillum mobile]